MSERAGTTYLYHLDSPISHAQHYVGWTRFFKKRDAHHRGGTGSRLLAEAVRRGINFRCVRKWKNTDGHFEQKLKRQKNSRLLCPECRKAKRKILRGKCKNAA